MASSKFAMIKKRVNDQHKDCTATTRSKPHPATVDKTPRITSFYCPRSLRARMSRMRSMTLAEVFARYPSLMNVYKVGFYGQRPFVS
eukprot:scaffold955_cov54-Cyclotella_meneghiniana.AAC.2